MTWWADFKAWRRGDRRVAPAGCRGRIYEKRDGAHRVNHETTFRVRARVIRADGSPDEHYDLTEAGNG